MDGVSHLYPKDRKGLVVVITGHGKGKTTTALGIAVRACGHGMKTSIIQFMKGDIYAGEWDGVKKMDCSIELIATSPRPSKDGIGRFRCSHFGRD